MAVSIDRAIRRGLIAASIAVAAGYTAPAFALEFGALHVRSHLNQPLDATVVLNDLDASERASLDVGIAPPAMFQRFGIRRSSAVDRIHIDTHMTDGGRRAVVHIDTDRPISEPFVDFLLQVDSGNGSALREYTAMLNPASESANSPSAPTRSATSATHHAAAASQRSVATTGSTHQVQPGETLWSIAAANTPPNATVAQTVLAIYRANPSAFNGSMSALSGHARLKIPRAGRIRAVNATKAEQRLVRTRHTATDASTKPTGSASADSAGKLAASGEAPPARLKQNAGGSTTTGAGSPPSSGNATSSGTDTSKADASNQAAQTTQGAFGKLSLPSDAPWPQSPTPAAQKSASGPSSSATTAAPAVSGTVSSTGESASGTTANDTPVTKKSAPKTAPKSAPVDTPPTSDVSKADGSALLSPRNLLLLIVLVALVALILRRLRDRGYKPVELDRELSPGPAAAETVETPPPSAASSVEAAADAYRAAPAMDTPPPPEAEPTPVPAANVRPAGASDGSALETPPEDESPAEPVASPEREAPYLEPSGTSASGMGTPDAEASLPSGADEPEATDYEPGTPKQDIAPMRFEPVNAPESGLRLPAHRRAATNEEIEALAFEAQSLPDTAERQHDLGDDQEPAMEFIETNEQTGPASPGDGDESGEVHRPDPYGLEMIDPGEFDLYDPPSETAGSTDDDPNHSVEIRLDLARMYIEMDDDQAARELLVDVRERGDEPQRDEAGRLLERLDG